VCAARADAEKRNRLGARGRVVLASTLTLFVTACVLVSLSYLVTVRSLDAATDRALKREAEAYLGAMRGSPQGGTLVTATRSYLGARTAEAGIDPILIVALNQPGPGWRILSNSDVRLENAGSNIPLQSPPRGAETLNVSLGGKTYRVLAAPILDANGNRAGMFEAALALDAQRRTARALAITLTITGLVAVAAGFLLSLWTAGRALQPLRRMAADAAEVTHAEPGRRLAYKGPPDALGSLADSVNQMLDRLEAGAAEQRRFIADASHELRTPVAIVRGNVELLQTRDDIPAGADEQLEMIASESGRMTRLLDELLVLARLQGAPPTRFQPLHAPTILAEVAARARLLGHRQITSSCTFTDAWVSGDPDQLEQALLNIVRNAVAHTDDGGHIDIDCRYDGRTVRFRVTDDGPGIAEKDLGRIFDRFYRSQGEREGATGGAGLGLPIAKALVELHEGRITAENVEPHGARFTIELLAIEPPAGSDPAEP
jgi:two-component system OmpR family sensor kinase